VLYEDLRKSSIAEKYYKAFADEFEKGESDVIELLSIQSGFSTYIKNNPKDSSELKQKINSYFRILNLIEYVIEFDKKFIDKGWLEFWRIFNKEYNQINKTTEIVDDVMIYFDNKLGVIEPHTPEEQTTKPPRKGRAKTNGQSGPPRKFKFDILAVIAKRNEEEEEIEKLIEDFESKIEKLFAFIASHENGKRLIAKLKSYGSSFSEDEIYSDFDILYKKFVRRNKEYLGDFFINETKDSVNKLCDDFEKHLLS
jgi:type I restriction enzyme R subunit